jgi:hypothetical protein
MVMQTDIRGETIRWSFDDGPTKGTVFEHTFNQDGSVSYRMDGSNKTTREDHYECVALGDAGYVVSYLAKSGWTLTAVLDEKDKSVTAIASNAQQLVVQHGHFEHLRRGHT